MGFSVRVLFLAGAIGWVVACSGLGDRVKQVMANQLARVLADALDVPPDQVHVVVLESGNWALDTPGWDAECSVGDTAELPDSFLFDLGDTLVGSCVVAEGCAEVLGLPCAEGLGLALTYHPQGTTTADALLMRRRSELEARGWTVEAEHEGEGEPVVLTASADGVSLAVAVIPPAQDGGMMEILAGALEP